MEAVRLLKTPENAALMRGFCSVGRNCEFGFAQRWSGADPLDLLRWASTPLPVLIGLLRERFAGIGDDLSLRVLSANGQYFVINRRIGFEWHAWVREGEIPPDRLLQREAKRLPRMAEFFVETLTEANRIFVRVPEASETLSDATALLDELRQYGPATLLFVNEDPARAGRVDLMRPGLMVGWIDQFSPITLQLTHTDVWLEICRNAESVKRRQQPEGAE